MSGQTFENDEMKEIINDFLVETTELIENVIRDIVAIEESPDEELINGIFRAVHTIKGTSSFLGFTRLSNLAHKSEDLLGMVRKGEIRMNKDIGDALLEAADLMRVMVEKIKDSGTDEEEIEHVVKGLESLIKKEKEEKKPLGEILVEEKVITREELEVVLEKQKEGENKRLGEIVVEEKLITESQLNTVLNKQKSYKEDQTVRIDVKKLDELMNLVGELVLGKNRLTMVNTLAKRGTDNGVLENLEEVSNYIEVITNDLQLAIMKARLVPMSKVFNKIPRMVRDLSKEFGKEITLKISGEETELDRSLIESLHDPLVHIIRNSVDHGIETPEERRRSGKDEKGTLSISAYNEGNNVIIEVFDDGKGINVQAVKEKVKEKGLMSESDLNALSDKEAMNLIFIPGLSTAKKVTKVSGRGVGMDVVRSNIEKMNGQVYIDSESGKWTKLTIKLPLTLAIMRALIVKVEDDIFAIPLNNVIELVKLKKGMTKTVDKNEVFVLRDSIIPVLDMPRVFFSGNGNTGVKEEGDIGEGYLVICRISDKTIGVKVKSVIGQEEVVIKPLGEFMGNVNGIGGATIRGDGKVILILDIPAMISSKGIQHFHRKGVQVVRE
ncbi:MAG: chemotaxis protein CheA [Syntrophorhabdaceae bacterium]|nr:chemotaxis protein CheA [Syntrophorhabdaceae bacterium]